MSKLKLHISMCLIGLLLLMAGCDSSITNEEKSADHLETQNLTETFQQVTDPGVNQTLANVRSATARFHDVDKAEAEGYQQVSPFVTGMGYHYVNEELLLDGNIDPLKPEALVYVDNPVHADKRRLVAVEYLVPFKQIDEKSQSELEGMFPGVDADKWHAEGGKVQSWTLHAWIWYPNPEGVFHPTNPRVGSGN